jgi:hypothetical protein
VKSGTINIEKEYAEFADMSPAEVVKWLNDLVVGLKRREDHRASQRDEQKH